MAGASTTWGTVLEGHSVRKVENRWCNGIESAKVPSTNNGLYICILHEWKFFVSVCEYTCAWPAYIVL